MGGGSSAQMCVGVMEGWLWAGCEPVVTRAGAQSAASPSGHTAAPSCQDPQPLDLSNYSGRRLLRCLWSCQEAETWKLCRKKGTVLIRGAGAPERTRFPGGYGGSWVLISPPACGHCRSLHPSPPQTFPALRSPLPVA